LSGVPLRGLLSSLKLRNHRALYSRLACQLTLPVYSGAQCAQYLSAALVAAGLSAQVLEPAATELLSAASGSRPRSLSLAHESQTKSPWLLPLVPPISSIT
jgi:hypothetical protein